MAKQGFTVRYRILEHLKTYGDVVDPEGRATAVLTEALGLPASRVSTVSAMVTNLGHEGLIEREVAHRRCYMIRIAGSIGKETLSRPEVDHDLLAKAVLVEVMEAMQEVEGLRAENARLKRQLESGERFAIQALLKK